jgi:hypothetical protein
MTPLSRDPKNTNAKLKTDKPVSAASDWAAFMRANYLDVRASVTRLWFHKTPMAVGLVADG